MIQEELSAMRRDVGQARELIRDAVEKLLLSFDVIARSAAEGELDERTRARMQREIGVVVTALQFQDMVDQLLNHVLQRMTMVEQGLGGSAGAADEARAADGPVAQRRMNEGDAELF
jgi:hypothetical protein